MKTILKLENVKARVGDKEILKGVSLTINQGEVHAIMGPNGAGKSTLAALLSGREDIEVTEGRIEFLGQDLLSLDPRERALAGLFLGYQHPVEVPGLTNVYFLKAALDAKRKHQGLEPLDSMDFLKVAKKACVAAGLEESFLQRPLNHGLSGGEKKRNEMLQMTLLEPTLAVLDEMDSGLDVDALKKVTQTLAALKHPERAYLLITHYPRLLEDIKPDVVHLLIDGQIKESSDLSLAYRIESEGYKPWGVGS